ERSFGAATRGLAAAVLGKEAKIGVARTAAWTRARRMKAGSGEGELDVRGETGGGVGRLSLVARGGTPAGTGRGGSGWGGRDCADGGGDHVAHNGGSNLRLPIWLASPF